MLRWILTIVFIGLIIGFYLIPLFFLNTNKEETFIATSPPEINTLIERPTPPPGVPMAPETLTKPITVLPSIPEYYPPAPMIKTINVNIPSPDQFFGGIMSFLKDIISVVTGAITIYTWFTHIKKKKKRKPAHA